MAKDEPTILLGPNFVMDDPDLLGFMNFCVQWARQLHDVAGRISLKFVYGEDNFHPRQLAEFMWQGALFVQLRPVRVKPESEVFQYAHELLENNFSSLNGNHYPLDRLWEELFRPNLKAAIRKELDRLNNLKQDIDEASLKNPETSLTV